MVSLRPLLLVAPEFQLAISSNSHQSLAFCGKAALKMPISDVSSLRIIIKKLKKGFNREDVGRCFMTTHAYQFDGYSFHTIYSILKGPIHGISLQKVWGCIFSKDSESSTCGLVLPKLYGIMHFLREV